MAVAFVISLSVFGIVQCSADTPGLTIDVLSYDSSEGTISCAGRSSDEFVNIQLVGEGYYSPVSATAVSGGCYSDTIYVGDLPDGTYICRVGTGSYAVERIIVLDGTAVELTSAAYDPATNVVSFTGTSTAAVVNVHVIGPNVDSPVTAESVSGGLFSGSLWVGDLDAGDYICEAGANNVRASLSFTVVSDLVILNTVFDDSTGIASLTVRSVNGEPHLNVTTPSGAKTSLSFGSAAGDIYSTEIEYDELGDYTFELTCNSDVYQSTYSHILSGFDVRDYGHTLISYTGTVSELVIPSCIRTIESGAFDDSRIFKLVINKDIEWNIIINETFPLERCGITELVLGPSVTSIPDYLFAKTGITELTIPESIRSIGVKSFYACPGLKTVTFAEKSHIMELGDYAFSHNPVLEAVKFGSSGDGFDCDIGTAAFLCCSALKKVTIGDGFVLRTIGDLAFAKFYNSKSPVSFNHQYGIRMPASVESIGALAFGVIDTQDSISHEKEPGNGIYKGYWGSSNYSLECRDWVIKFDEGSEVGSIGVAAFAGLSGIREIDLSYCDKLSTIGAMAFNRTIDSSEFLKLPVNVIEIGGGAFSYPKGGIASSSSSIKIPDSVQVLDNAFEDIAGELVFGQGSELRRINLSLAENNMAVDLRPCLQLEEIWNLGGSSVKTNPGVFIGDGRVEGKGVVDGTGVLELDESVRVLLSKNLNNVKEVRVEGQNPYFKYDEDTRQLTFQNGTNRLLLWTDSSDVIDLRDIDVWEDALCRQVYQGSGVYSDAVSVRELRLSEVVLSEGALEGCKNLDSIFVLGEDIFYSDYESYLGTNDRAITMYFGPGCTVDDYAKFQRLGDVMIGYACGATTVYLPYYEGLNDPTYVDGKLLFDANVLEGIEVLSSNCQASISGDKLIVIPSETTESFVWFFKKDLAKISIFLDYNGGTDLNGASFATIKAIPGQTLSDILSSIPIKDKYRFDGWSSKDGSEFDSMGPLLEDCEIKAKWVARGSLVTVDADSTRFIRCDGEPWSGSIEMSPGKSIKLEAMEVPGYQLLNWIVNNRISDTPVTEGLEITYSEDDIQVSVGYRFYSTSSGLIPISDRGMPSADQSDDAVYSFDLGGYLKAGGSNWTGHASVPLIVDNTIYFRAGNYLYAAESDTGYIFAKVQSVSVSSFYHQIGYGGGYIIDYPVGKVYNLNLEQLYILDRSIGGAEYYDGRFYSSGSSVYSFDPNDEDPSRSDEIKKTTLVGKIPNSFGSYGFTSSVFVDHYMYRVVVDGSRRGIAAMDLNNGSTSSYYLSGLNYLYLDDGWISYNAGRVYLTGYSEGLFGAIASNDNSCVSFVSVDGLKFDSNSEGAYRFDGKGWVSQIVFYNDVAYVQASGYIYRFDVVDGAIEFSTAKKVNAAYGHGSIALDVSRLDENGNPIVCIYSIPYRSTNEYGMTITEDRGGVLRTVVVPGLYQYNSQAVRTDKDGGMIWYNDSGHIFKYTTPEKNRFFFFLDNGYSATWCESYGRDRLDALLSLDESIIEIDRSYNVKSILGVPVESFSVWALVCQAPMESINEDLSIYDWTRIDNLFTRTQEASHYVQIVSGDAPVVGGTEFNYLNGSDIAIYRFTNSIGDRSLVGKMLAYGEDVSVLRFYKENGEEIDNAAMIGATGSKVVGEFPEVFNTGFSPSWIDDRGQIISSLTDLTYGGTSSCTLRWVKLPGSFEINGDWTSEDLRITVVSEKDVGSNYCIQVIFNTSPVYATEMSDLSFEGGLASLTLSDVSDYSEAFVRILMKSDAGRLSNDYGHLIVKRGVAA